MKSFEGILICTDLDGTILRDDKTVSEENREAIEYFKSKGGYFTFITGRMPYFAEDIYEMIKPNAPIGCINGGGIYDFEKREYLHTVSLPRTALELVHDAACEIPEVGIQIVTFDKVYFSRENDAMRVFREETGMPNTVKPYTEVTEPIAKVVFGDLSDSVIRRLDKFLTTHPKAEHYDFIRSDDMLYEILPKGVSKGAVLPRLAKILSVDMKRTVAIGDYDNDVTMLRAAGVGVAVGNATAAAKAAADLVTVKNSEHAIARLIYDIDEGKIRI